MPIYAFPFNRVKKHYPCTLCGRKIAKGMGCSDNFGNKWHLKCYLIEIKRLIDKF